MSHDFNPAQFQTETLPAADPRGLDFLEVTLGADGAGSKVRQILNKKLKAEGRSLSHCAKVLCGSGD